MVHPIKQYRNAHQLTAYDLGKKLGVTATTVWRWESGERKVARRVWPKLSALGISVPAIAALESDALSVEQSQLGAA